MQSNLGGQIGALYIRLFAILRPKPQFGTGNDILPIQTFVALHLEMRDFSDANNLSRKGKAFPNGNLPILEWHLCSDSLSESFVRVADSCWDEEHVWSAEKYLDNPLLLLSKSGKALKYPYDLRSIGL